MDVEDEDAGGFSNVASEDERMEVPQSSTVEDSIASPDGKLEQEMEQDICSPDGLDSNMDEVSHEEVNQDMGDEEFVSGRKPQESDNDDDMVTSSNTIGEDESNNPDLEGQSNDEQPGEIDDINNEGQEDSVTEQESDKVESRSVSRRDSEEEESVGEDIDNRGVIESASESDIALNDSISEGADSRDSFRDKSVALQNIDIEENTCQSELDLTLQHSSEVDENGVALHEQYCTNEGAIDSPDIADSNELDKCESKADSVQSNSENVESKNFDDKSIEDDDESSIENDDDERGSDDENFDTIGSSFDEDADADNKDLQFDDKSEEIVEGKEDQNFDNIHSPVEYINDGEEQDQFALHDNIPGSPDDLVDQNTVPEQEENIGLVESESKLFVEGDTFSEDFVAQGLTEKEQTAESSEKNSVVSDGEFEERNENEDGIPDDDDREDISEEEDYNDNDAIEENIDSLEKFQNDCGTERTGNSAGQSLLPDNHSDAASGDENDDELDLTKGAPDTNTSVNVPRDSAASPDASDILEPSVVRKQESVEHEDIDSPESDIGDDIDDNPASPVSSDDREAEKEGIYNDVSDEEEVYSDDESKDVGAKNSVSNANVSSDKPQQVVFIRKMSLDKDGFDTFKDPLQRSKLEVGTFKSQSSLPEDHVELDYDEDGMDDMAKDKEKMDDSRGDEEEDKREMEDGEQFSDKDDGEVEDDEDCEEGEIKEPGARKPFVKPICRFFTRGQCTWGNNCRFLHPGINDKGNYRLIERPGMDGGPRGFGGRPWQEEPPFEELPPPPAAPVPESAWERGLKQAKELLKKSSQRKELEPDFEVKKYNMSVEEDRDFNKENDRQKVDKIIKDPYYDQVYDDEYYDKPHQQQQPHSWQPGQYENFEVHWTREPEEWIPPPHHRQPPPYMHERENYSPRHFSPPVERFHDRRREHRRPRQWEENREVEEYVPPRPKADQWHDPWRRSKSPKRKPRMSRSHSRGRRRARRSHSYSSSFSSSSFSGSSRSRSRSSSYSLSSRSSFSRSSSGSSRSRSPHKSPVKRPPGDRKGPGPVSKVNNDQPRSAVAVKGKGPRSPDKRRQHSAHHGHPGQRPGIPPKPGGHPGGPLPPHPSQRGRPPHRGMPPSRPKRRSGSESSSGSSGSRSHSSSSASSRSSSASSGSSISSHSSVSSSGSADSEHLYRGVGSKEAASGPQKRKGPVPRPKTAKRPGRDHGGPPGGNRMHPRGGPGNKMERGGKPDPRGGPGGKPEDPRGGPGGKIDQRSGPGGPKLEQRSMKAGPGGVKPDSRGPGGLRSSKDGRHGPEANRQPPSVQTKAKDPLKQSGQKPNIKLTLLNKQPTDKPPVAKKRPAEQNLTQPPAKRPTHPTAAPPKPQEKTLKKPEKVVRPPALKPKPAPVSPTKAPVRPPGLLPTKAPPKPVASALAAAAAAAQKEKKSTSSRREELLRQLKAVEDAIARKRSKME